MQPQQEQPIQEQPKSPKSPSYKRGNRTPKRIRLPSPTKSKGGSKRRNKNKSNKRVK